MIITLPLTSGVAEGSGVSVGRGVAMLVGEGVGVAVAVLVARAKLVLTGWGAEARLAKRSTFKTINKRTMIPIRLMKNNCHFFLFITMLCLY